MLFNKESNLQNIKLWRMSHHFHHILGLQQKIVSLMINSTLPPTKCLQNNLNQLSIQSFFNQHTKEVEITLVIQNDFIQIEQ